jgi:hypothetical protein
MNHYTFLVITSTTASYQCLIRDFKAIVWVIVAQILLILTLFNDVLSTASYLAWNEATVIDELLTT